MIKIKEKKQKKVKKWKNYKSDKSAKVTKVTKVTKWHKWHKWQTWQKWNKVKQGCTHKNTSHIFCTPTLKSAPFLLCLFGSLVSLVSFSRRFLLKNIIFQWFFLAGLAGPQAWLAGPQAWLDGPEGGTDKQTDGQKIYPFYRTLSPIWAAAQK